LIISLKFQRKMSFGKIVFDQRYSMNYVVASDLNDIGIVSFYTVRFLDKSFKNRIIAYISAIKFSEKKYILDTSRYSLDSVRVEVVVRDNRVEGAIAYYSREKSINARLELLVETNTSFGKIKFTKKIIEIFEGSSSFSSLITLPVPTMILSVKGALSPRKIVNLLSKEYGLPGDPLILYSRNGEYKLRLVLNIPYAGDLVLEHKIELELVSIH